LVDGAQLQVILQVLADARLVEPDLDAEIAQAFGRADARTLQDLDAADRARRQDDFPSCPDLSCWAEPRRTQGLVRLAGLELDADHPTRGCIVEHEARHVGPAFDLEIRPCQHRTQESAGGIPSHPATLVHLEVPAAEVVAPVEVLGLGDSRLGRCFLEGIEYRPAQAHPLDPPLAAMTMGRIGPAAVEPM